MTSPGQPSAGRYLLVSTTPREMRAMSTSDCRTILPQFAVHSIARWWEGEGRREYPGASALLILADSGGSNGCRARAWKLSLQEKLCDESGLTVTVCHYPTGCSKWNPDRAPAVQLHQQELGGKAPEDFGSYAGIHQGNEHGDRIECQSLLGRRLLCERTKSNGRGHRWT